MKQGEKIRFLRNLKGISQDFMAAKLNITQPAYASIEGDKTKLSVERLKEIANLLEVKAEDIINFDEKIHIEYVSNSQVGSGTYNEKEGNLKLIVSNYETQINFLKEQIRDKDIMIANLLKKIN